MQMVSSKHDSCLFLESLCPTVHGLTTTSLQSLPLLCTEPLFGAWPYYEFLYVLP